MTVWANSVVIDDNGQAATADSGTFTTVGGNGRSPVPSQPMLGVYPINTQGGSSGGTVAGQGGGVSVF
jgi:hypothetical protein